MKTTIRIALLGTFLGLTTGTVYGQQAVSPGALKSQMAYTDGFGARVIVDESPELDLLFDRTTDNGGRIQVYRITIFSDNSQAGRERAAEAMSRFRSAFPGIPVNRSYESPDWKVIAGYCLTPDEAASLFGQVKTLFPSAILRETVVPVSELRAARNEAEMQAEMPAETVPE